MSTKCEVCGSKKIKVQYKMKPEYGKTLNQYREFLRCRKSIRHSYTEDSLACIDISVYEDKQVA